LNLFFCHLRQCGPLHLAFPGNVVDAYTNIQRVASEEEEKKTLHMWTHGAMRGCGLISLVVCINDKFHDIRERNVTIRSEN
jgi:hypothetical protein